MHARRGCTRACALSCKEGVRAQTHANVQAHARSRLASMRADSNACTRTREHARSHTKASTCQFLYAARMCADALRCWCKHRRAHVYSTGVGVRKLTSARQQGVRTNAHAGTRTHARTRMCKCSHLHTRASTPAHMLARVYMCVHMCNQHLYTRTRMRTHAHKSPFEHRRAHVDTWTSRRGRVCLKGAYARSHRHACWHAGRVRVCIQT